MKYYFLLLVFVFGFSCREKVSIIDVRDQIVFPQNYIVPLVTSPIIIDGLDDDKSWQSSFFTKNFIDIEGVLKPKYNTKIKMGWDKDYLYVFALLEEPHIWGDITKRDEVIFYNNDFEVFVSPSGTTHNYGEIEINALGTVWDLMLNKPYRDGGKPNNLWDLEGLKSAINIRGSLNDPSDIDTSWTVEMAIPMRPLKELRGGAKGGIKEGEQWRVNFSRVEWDYDLVDGKYKRKKQGGNFLKEYNWVWSNQKVINMHEPEKWGYLQFTHEPTSANIVFYEDKNLLAKQSCFALFRMMKSGKFDSLLSLDEGSTQHLKVAYENDKYLDAVYKKTALGFEFKIKSPKTGGYFLIDKGGSLKVI